MDVEFRPQFRAYVGSDAVEGLERARDELVFGEVDAEDENLG